MKAVMQLRCITEVIIKRIVPRDFPGLQKFVVVQWLVSLPLDRPSRVRISARGLPTVWSKGRQITLLIQ